MKEAKELKFYPSKEINPAILAKMKEGYPQRKAVAITGLKNNNSKKK